MSDDGIIWLIADCIPDRRMELFRLLQERLDVKIDVMYWLNIPKVKKWLVLKHGTFTPLETYDRILNILTRQVIGEELKDNVSRIIKINQQDYIFQQPNYDSTLLEKKCIEKSTKFNIKTNRQIEAVKDNQIIYQGRYENMKTVQQRQMRSKEEENKERKDLEKRFFLNFNQRFNIRNMTIEEAMIQQKQALKQYVNKNLFKTWKPEVEEEPLKMKYSNERWLNWLKVHRIHYQILYTLKLDKIISTKQLKLLIQKYDIHLIKSKFKLIGIHAKKIAGDYFYYRICNITSLGDLIENTFRKEQMNGELITEIESNIFIIQTFIHTNVRISQNKQEILDLIGKEENEVDFTLWKQYDWKFPIKRSSL
jgi:hypothetical protein